MDGQQPRVLGGRYRLQDVLGVGGMSTVWRARDEVLGRAVAVKVLSGDDAAGPDARQRIRDEARAAAALSHPNIAQVHDFGEAVEAGQRTPYVVMELVAGPTLGERAKAGPLPPRTVFRVCAEVAAALAAAHAEGLVHRDVKPANVILAVTGAKVVDFGIAAAIGPAPGDPDDLVLGTPQYLAPERLTDRTVAPASDVYSLGVLLYRLLAGRLPWTTESSTGLLEAHLYEEPAPLPRLDGVPPEVVELCHRCLAKDPDGRPPASEVAIVLAAAAGVRTVEDALAHTTAPTTAGGEPSTVLVRRSPAAPGPALGRRRRRTPNIMAVVVGAVAAAVVAWILLPRPPDAAPPVAGPSTPAATSTVVPRSGQTAVAGAPSPSTAPAGTPAPTTGGAPTRSPAARTPGTPTPTVTGPVVLDTTRTFHTAGGSVEAGCTATGLAHLVSYTPKPSYRVADLSRGPAASATVAFRGTETVRLTVTCDGGGVSGSISTE